MRTTLVQKDETIHRLSRDFDAQNKQLNEKSDKLALLTRLEQDWGLERQQLKQDLKETKSFKAKILETVHNNPENKSRPEAENSPPEMNEEYEDLRMEL